MIDNNYIAQINKEENGMCYRTMDYLVKSFSLSYNKNSNERRFRSIKPFLETLNKVMINKEVVVGIEINTMTKEGFTWSEKDALKVKYGINTDINASHFTFKNKRLRPFVHAFNVAKKDNTIQLLQSWYLMQDYHIFKTTDIDGFNKYIDLFTTYIDKDMTKLPSLFDPEYNKESKKLIPEILNILRMVNDMTVTYNLILKWVVK